MCGFCGMLSKVPVAESHTRVTAMVKTLRHRGPDAEGIFTAPGIALGHCRLSIIDLTDAGSQPMEDPNTGVCVSYNGEVYNFQELRQELVRGGVSFAGHSDTEVLLRSYVQWGLEGLRRLEGIFAFALWDPRHERLVLMRDRFGVKPLYYSQTAEALVFGSEIKALLAAEGADTSLDDQALREYLWFGNSYEERTIYRGVRSLPPGSWLVVEGGKQRIESYWKLEDWLDIGGPRTPEDAEEAVRAAVDAAVTRQLVADVPVGVFLSGGVDSSTIAASAARSAGQAISSYSVGFDFTDHADELPAARLVAEELGLQHHEVHVSSSDLHDVLLQLARAHDEPFGDPANIPLFLLARGISGSLKVVLQGDGGDEMFGGYRRYSLLRHHRLWSTWPKAMGPALHRIGRRTDRIARLLAALSAPTSGMQMALLLTPETMAFPPETVLRHDARDALVSMTDPFLAYEKSAMRFRNLDPVDRMLLTDISLQLSSQYLPKVDRATMAHSVEARVPLLDEQVARLAIGMPSALKVRGREKKVVLRNAMRGRVPSTILDAPKKGFGVPFDRWLQHRLHDWAREAVLAEPVLHRFGLDKQVVEGMFRRHKAGEHNHGPLIWKLFQLALWLELQD